jgi:hypothetical protein
MTALLSLRARVRIAARTIAATRVPRFGALGTASARQCECQSTREETMHPDPSRRRTKRRQSGEPSEPVDPPRDVWPFAAPPEQQERVPEEPAGERRDSDDAAPPTKPM